MKYMGSKGRIAKHILPIILKDRKPNQFYVEPFVGGGNMIDKVYGNRMGFDINEYLVALLQEMISGWDPPYLDRNTVEVIKNNKDNYPKYLVGWAGFCCSYSGKFFGGYAGVTTTKNGSIRDYIKEAVNNFKEQSIRLQGCLIECSDYLKIIFPKNSIIYCDPPYKGTEGYRVKFDHDIFWEWCRIKTVEGHQVFISEYSAPDDFECVWSMELSSSLSANGKTGGSKKSTEKLFVYRLPFHDLNF